MNARQYLLLCVFVVMATAIGLVAMYAHYHANEAWHQFRADHHCQARSHTEPPAGLTTAPGQTTWVCDDGQTYVKNDD